MNRGVLQSSPVQQMMAAGNPNWWNMINSTRPPNNTTSNLSPFSPSLPVAPTNLFPQYPSWYDSQGQLPESWSQLLVGRMVDEEDKTGGGMVADFQNRVVNVKQEMVHHSSNYFYGHASDEQNFQMAQAAAAAAAAIAKPNSWSPVQVMPLPPAAAAASLSPKSSSCVTASFSSSNMLDFTTATKAPSSSDGTRHTPPDRSSDVLSNSHGSGGAVAKKARVQSSSPSSQSTFKVRKEKLGDRITALHQIVSPFGKTDTASVLLEAIGYIRFLQSQIEALSLPYLGSGSPNLRQHSHPSQVQGERNSIFPEDPGQLLNDNCMKRKGASDHHQELSQEEAKKDLRSRGLCLVPVSCMLQVGSDNGADFWAPAVGGGSGGCFR